MAARENSGVNIQPGVISRVAAGVRYMISGAQPNSFFGAQQPLAPQAQEATEGRAFDYPVGVNIRIEPRNTEGVSFAMLRAFAEQYDLLRIILEKRKDQIEAFDWEIVPKDKNTAPDSLSGPIEKATDILMAPCVDPMVGTWAGWLRAQIEDMLVLDAICVYPRMTKGGQFYSFDLVAPETITRKITDDGRTPLPPDPAYQQILKGIPANDLTTDDLIYRIRNPRTNRLYGYGPVEQILFTVNLALRRQMSQLSFYTVGNVPEAIAQAPELWTPKQIDDFQTRFDALLSGQLGNRRKITFVPNLKNIVFPKLSLVKDEFDEWLARLVCFAFSISPTALITHVNRANSEQMSDTAKEEGLMPLLRFIESHVTGLVQKCIDPKLKFQFKIVNRVDPVQQANVDKIYIDSEVYTPDEVRESLGRDAMTPAEREKAWPTPVPPGFMPDGSPVLPKGAPNAGPGSGGSPGAGGGGGTGFPPKVPGMPSATEKMLADALAMLDPEKLAKVAQMLAPNVVNVKPEVNVQVGETTVNVPGAK